MFVQLFYLLDSDFRRLAPHITVKFLRIKAVAKKELLHILRDPLSLAMAFLMPVILLVIFGYAITFDINTIPAVVVDQDRSNLSRGFVSALQESGYFSIVAYPERHGDIDGYLDSGKARLAVVIPPGFSKKLSTGGSVQVGVSVDGSDSNTATIAQGYLAAIAGQYPQRIEDASVTPLVDARTRVWYNPELKSRNFIIPGLIALIISVIVTLLTSLTIAREWERGTMEQLISTPLKTPELIIGKLIPYFFIGFIDTVASVLMGTLVYGVPLRGSPVLLLALASIFLFGGLSWGILISIIARTQMLASQMAILSTFLPAFLLSGFMFAIANMPKPLQLVTYIVPARYFVTILKDIFLKGSTFRLLAGEALLLTMYGLLVFAMANKKFKKKVV
jgi:ABC-2 type transport system permease protein